MIPGRSNIPNSGFDAGVGESDSVEEQKIAGVPSLPVRLGVPPGLRVAFPGQAGERFGDDCAQFAQIHIFGDAFAVTVVAEGPGSDHHRIG